MEIFFNSSILFQVSFKRDKNNQMGQLEMKLFKFQQHPFKEHKSEFSYLPPFKNVQEYVGSIDLHILHRIFNLRKRLECILYHFRKVSNVLTHKT